MRSATPAILLLVALSSSCGTKRVSPNDGLLFADRYWRSSRDTRGLAWFKDNALQPGASADAIHSHLGDPDEVRATGPDSSALVYVARDPVTKAAVTWEAHIEKGILVEWQRPSTESAGGGNN